VNNKAVVFGSLYLKPFTIYKLLNHECFQCDASSGAQDMEHDHAISGQSDGCELLVLSRHPNEYDEGHYHL
jgi:hypothetical protein